MAPKDVRIRLGYQVDEQAVARALTSADQVMRSLERVADPLGDLGIAAAGSVRRIEGEFLSLRHDIDAVAADTRDFRDELEQLDRVEVTPTVNVQGLDRGRGGRLDLDQFDRAGMVGSQILSGLGQSDAANLAGLASDTVSAIGSLNPVMLAVTAAGAGLALVLGDIQAKFAANQKAAEEFADRLVSNAELIAGGATSVEVNAQADRLRGVISTIDDQLVELTSREERLYQLRGTVDPAETAEFFSLFEEISAIVGRPIEDFEALQQAIDAITVRSTEYHTALLNLNQVLVSGDLALNDAAAKSAAAAESNAAALDVLRGAGENLVDLIQNNATVVLEEYTKYLEVAATKTKQLMLIEQERQRAAEAVLQQGVTSAVDTLFGVRKDMVDKVNALAEAERTLATFEGERASKINAITAAGEERRTLLLAKAQTDREKLEQQHQDAIDEINRHADSSLTTALRTRNVVAAIVAQETRDEALRREEKTNKQRLDSLQGSLDEQLDTIRDNTEKAVQAERDRVNKERAIRQRAIQQAENDLRNARAAERAAEQQHQASLQTLQKQVQIAEQNERIRHLQMLESVHRTGAVKIVDAVVTELNKGIQRIGGTGAKGLNMPTMQKSLAPLGSTYNTPFAFTAPLPSPVASPTVNLNLYAPDSTKTIRDVSRQVALQTVRQLWEG